MNQQQRAVVQQALDAFAVLKINDYSGYECTKHETDKIDDAETALRQLLEQPEPVPLTDDQIETIIKSNMSLQMNLAGIRQDFEAAYIRPTGDILTPDEAQPADQPDYEFHYRQLLEKYEALQSASQPAAWVGLTQREWDDLWDEHHDDYGYQLSVDGYERAIEAKLREKNGGAV